MSRFVRAPRALLALLLTATSTVAVGSGIGGVPIVSAACSYCGGGEYHEVTPTRIFDSRPTSDANPQLPINDVAPFGAKPINLASSAAPVVFNVRLLGVDGDATYENAWLPADVVLSDLLAVAVSITVIAPGTRGNLSAYPTGTTPSVRTSVVNFDAGQTVPNLSIVRPGTNGNLTIDLRGAAASTAHLTVDVFGWFSTSTYRGPDRIESDDERGGRFIGITPGRVLDTATGAVGPQSTTEVQIRGASALGGATTLVPDSPSVRAVVLNVSGVKPTAPTFVSVLPENPSGSPSTSNLNLQAGQIRSAMVIVPIGADGKVRLYNAAGSLRLVVDVVGYVEQRLDETRAGRIIPLTSPFRVFDTRQVTFGKVPLGPGQTELWSFSSFADSVNVGGVKVGAQAGLIGNLTNAALLRQYPTMPVTSNLRIYPGGGSATPPLAATLTSREGSTVGNLAMVTYGGTQQVYVFNAWGYAHYVLDVSAIVLAD